MPRCCNNGDLDDRSSGVEHRAAAVIGMDGEKKTGDHALVARLFLSFPLVFPGLAGLPLSYPMGGGGDLRFPFGFFFKAPPSPSSLFQWPPAAIDRRCGSVADS